MYDIIGDVHGHARPLENLLSKLGYVFREDHFRHPDGRMAIFLGDFINKGPDIKKALSIVKPMVDKGSAYAVLGNHEFELLWYFTKKEAGLYDPNDNYNLVFPSMVQDTLEAFKDGEDELLHYREWFQTLPLFLDLKKLRVVHACWYQPYVNFLEENYPDLKYRGDLLEKSWDPSSHEFKILKTLLRGPGFPLPYTSFYKNKFGQLIETFRIKWWENPFQKSYKDLDTKNLDLPEENIPDDKATFEYAYPAGAPPLFIGHYCFNEKPRVFKSNLCCVDFCVVEQKFITAYKWDRGGPLSEKNLVY